MADRRMGHVLTDKGGFLSSQHAEDPFAAAGGSAFVHVERNFPIRLLQGSNEMVRRIARQKQVAACRFEEERPCARGVITFHRLI
ncbi:hypothetical protein [Azospirillum sp. HJ39]|uniref:hypothetical protein n=1 Tax=Azospirillum sp. HJ39 TaxID=3159496 RepID=UPI0035590BA3